MLRHKNTAVETIAEELTAPERALLFCVVTGTEWAKGVITVETVRAVAIKGLIERDRTARLTLTKQPRRARRSGAQVDSRKHVLRTAGSREAVEQTLTDRLYCRWANGCSPMTWGRSWIRKSSLASRHLSSSSLPLPDWLQRRIRVAMAAAIRVTLTGRVMPTHLGRLTTTTARMIRYLGTIEEVLTRANG